VKDAFTAAGLWINDGPDADTYKVDRGKSFVNLHWLRHNRNTRIKKEHGPVAAQQYMGHENTDMTDHYTEFDPDEVQGLLDE
jgi:integrase